MLAQNAAGDVKAGVCAESVQKRVESGLEQAMLSLNRFEDLGLDLLVR